MTSSVEDQARSAGNALDRLSEAPPPAIAIDNLSVFFGQKAEIRAVDCVSFDVLPGQFISLVGPSGCGKTTVLNLISGLLQATTTGSIEVFGKAPAAGRSDIAYMLARDSLLPWRSALGNASYGMEIRGVPKTERRERARALLVEVGLENFIDHLPKALSHGMRQRCALARTFALDSPVFLMDEPFGALDAQTKIQLADVLTKLWSAHRRTVVFVTHDLAEAVALSDRVIVMSARPGQIVEDVTIDLDRPRDVRALQKNKRYHELCSYLWERLEQGMKQHAQ